MRIPLSWLLEYAQLPASLTGRQVGDALLQAGLEVETVEEAGDDVTGPLLVGRVMSFEEERHSNDKMMRWCQVSIGEAEPRGIVCGAANFAAGDLVVVALPGAVLPGGLRIGARKTYGHVSNGMICSERELGLGDDHTGIIVLADGEAEVGDDAFPVLYLRDTVLDLAITPDRGYCLSVRGVAREAATALGVPFVDPAAQEAETPAAASPGHGVVLEDALGCDVFAALTVEGFQAGAPSPRWLRRRVQLAGMRPISLGVDVTNHVMLELGQPIHGYDAERLDGAIVVRRARGAEVLTTLDGTQRRLDAEDLVIADGSGAIGLAGVMGGESTEMSESTSRVVIEAAHFDPVTVARAVRRHRLPSEASKRFERGVDPALPLVAVHRVAALLTQLGGGRITGVTLEGKPAVPQSVTIPADLPAKVLGMPVEVSTVEEKLLLVGCDVDRHDDTFTLTPPSWRPDLTDPYDFVEEVARLVGYDTIPSLLPAAPAGRGLTKTQRLRRRVGQVMAGAGFVESIAYPFVGPSDWSALGLSDDDPRRLTVRIANPLSDESPELRTTLLPGLLRTAARNLSRGRSGVSLFEVGSVFLPEEGGHPQAPQLGVDGPPSEQELASLEAALPRQPSYLAFVLAGDREAGGWWGPARDPNPAETIATARRLATVLGVTVSISGASLPPWHPGRCAELVLGELAIGLAGELHPKVCASFGLPPRSCAAELDLDTLFAAAPPLAHAPSLSNHPVAKEDVALVVSADVPAAAVESALRSGAGELLESVRLFDVYTGEQVGEGRKSLAFALRFRAPDRTLTEAETSAARDAAVARAAEATGAVQRT
jgi:phenylalanyl-tRNA synthetase beta chain